MTIPERPADTFFVQLQQLIQSLRKPNKITLGEPLLKARETTCVAALDIDFEDLVALALLRFITGEGKTKLKMVAILEKEYGANSPYLVQILTSEANTLRTLGRNDEAAKANDHIKSIHASAGTHHKYPRHAQKSEVGT